MDLNEKIALVQTLISNRMEIDRQLAVLLGEEAVKPKGGA